MLLNVPFHFTQAAQLALIYNNRHFLVFQDLSVLVNKMSQDINLEGSYYYFQFRASIVQYGRFNCLKQKTREWELAESHLN